MSIDEQHVALPKLYGAPAYARPPGPVATVARPFDPDDLPIDAYMTDDERDFASALPARAWAPGGAIVEGDDAHAHNGHQQRATRPPPSRAQPEDDRRQAAQRRLISEPRSRPSVTTPRWHPRILVGEGGLEPPTSEV